MLRAVSVVAESSVASSFEWPESYRWASFDAGEVKVVVRLRGLFR